MKIAYDVGVHDREIGRVTRLGHEVVCVAKQAEADEIWIERAMDNGAEIIFSDDLDIPNYLDKNNYDSVQHKKMWDSKNIIR